MYFLDSNVIIDLIRGNKSALVKRFALVHPYEIAIPSAVVAELEYGAWHSGEYERRAKEVMNVIQNFQIVPFGLVEAKVYGVIRHHLAAKGNIIGANDIFIAATAIAHDAVLVTHNTKEFSRIPTLATEDWAA